MYWRLLVIVAEYLDLGLGLVAKPRDGYVALILNRRWFPLWVRLSLRMVSHYPSLSHLGDRAYFADKPQHFCHYHFFFFFGPIPGSKVSVHAMRQMIMLITHACL